MKPITLAVGACLAALALVLPARAQTVLRFSTAAPPSDFLAKAQVAFKDELARTSPNDFIVNLHPASTLFRQGTEIPALQRGNLEMSTGTAFEVAQQVPEYGFLNRGYLIRDYAHLRRLFDGAFGEAYRAKVSEKMGIENSRRRLSRHPADEPAQPARRRRPTGSGGGEDAHAGRP